METALCPDQRGVPKIFGFEDDAHALAGLQWLIINICTVHRRALLDRGSTLLLDKCATLYVFVGAALPDHLLLDRTHRVRGRQLRNLTDAA